MNIFELIRRARPLSISQEQLEFHIELIKALINEEYATRIATLESMERRLEKLKDEVIKNAAPKEDWLLYKTIGLAVIGLLLFLLLYIAINFTRFIS